MEHRRVSGRDGFIDHGEGGAGSDNIEDLPTAETDTTKLLRPDGSGGVVWQADSIGRYEPLTNGIVASPELVFVNGDVIMVRVL